MPEKPTFASVTDVPCTCGFLQRSADEPSIPIVYDEHVGEFHVQCADGGTLILYHCPFCGGAAPPSKCGSLFANVSAAEQERLLMMTEGFHSVEDVIKALGPADEDYPRGAQWRQPEKESEPPRISGYRLLRYRGLSDSADLEIIDYGPKGISVNLVGKYIGNKT